MEREHAFNPGESEPDWQGNRPYLFGVVGFDAVRFQGSAELGEMFVIPRFNCAQHVDRRNIGAGKGALVHGLFNARVRPRCL